MKFKIKLININIIISIIIGKYIQELYGKEIIEVLTSSLCSIVDTFSPVSPVVFERMQISKFIALNQT